MGALVGLGLATVSGVPAFVTLTGVPLFFFIKTKIGRLAKDKGVWLLILHSGHLLSVLVWTGLIGSA